MQKLHSVLSILVVTVAASITANTVLAQGIPLPVELLPLGKDIGIGAGQTVTPAYEGWYTDDDGNVALSFGYYNRNTEQILELPLGAGNRIEGAPENQADQGQPTHFETGRHWGVFTVTVPADYKQQVVWHLESQGRSFDIAANRAPVYIIDAITGDANGNFPPEIRFAEDGPMGHGPEGITKEMVGKVGQPLTIDVWANDDGIGSGLLGSFMATTSGAAPMSLVWSKQQGPGNVTFDRSMAKVPVKGGKASTQATFSKAGDYMLRVEVNEFTGMEMAGNAQCCWTNGYVKVSVTN